MPSSRTRLAFQRKRCEIISRASSTRFGSSTATRRSCSRAKPGLAETVGRPVRADPGLLSLALPASDCLSWDFRLNTYAWSTLKGSTAGRAWCAPFQREKNTMPKFVIEREIAGAGKLARHELQAISQKSRSVLKGMGPQIQWVEGYVTDDKIYWVYVAPDEEAVRAH